MLRNLNNGGPFSSFRDNSSQKSRSCFILSALIAYNLIRSYSLIVSCPNCFLEQPKDQYCAGCGKQLDKLIEEKNKKISKTIKQTNYIIALITICFLSGSFYFYQSSNNSNNNTFAADASEAVKVKLSKTKIIGDKHSATFKAYATESPKLKKEIPKKIKAVIAIKTTVDEALDGIRKLKTFYFISINDCDGVFNTGEFDKEELKDILSCAKVHFKTSRKSFDDIIEDAPSFTTQFSLKQDEYLIELGFTLTTDIYVEEFKQTLPFEIEGASAATLWANTAHDIESSEAPDQDMLSNYATSALFNFAPEGAQPPQLYFLAQYK